MATEAVTETVMERYLDHSGALDLSGIDWDDIPNHPLRPDEILVLTYMMDVESHTITYLKELLSTPAIKVPRIQAFLSCWAYEEYFHGYALKKFLRAHGVTIDENRTASIQEQTPWLTRLFGLGQWALAKWAGERFIGVHMAWGATNELTTAEGYLRLAQRTEHPILKELLTRIMKDERRHYAFYFQEARERLSEPETARLTSGLIRRFFEPVGADIRSRNEVDAVAVLLFDGDEGTAIARRVDERIGTLPGLEGFTGVYDALMRSRARFGDAPAPLGT